jgi:acyl dehydratase
MTLDAYFAIGETVDLGTHHFDAESIKAFAARYDPQRFHMDEALAEGTVFGRLCASGWHTAAAWMKRNVAMQSTAVWDGPGPEPEFGPSPGFQNLKWLKPVYAGETVRYTRTATGYRSLASRPGWVLLTIQADGTDSQGDKVISFDSAVLVKVA